MTWSVRIEKTPAAEFNTAVDALALGDSDDADVAREEAQAQLAAAKEAAKTIMASGALGTEGEFIARLSGHAEPGHVLRPGSSQDFVNLIIQRYVDYFKE
jgi:hypothetical protein